MSSQSPTTAPAEPEFDPLAFWIEHKHRILAITALLVVGLGIYGIAEWAHSQKLASASAAFSAAKTADDFKKIASDYSGTAAAGNAELLLADALRKEGKLDESSTVLRTFIEKYPKHQMISGAWTSLAANQLAAGKVDDALVTYQKVSTSYAGSFSVPIALLEQARILKAKGKVDEARKTYEKIISDFQDSVASQEAALESHELKK